MQTWYDNPDYRNRCQALTWDGSAWAMKRENPDDVWSPPELVKKDCSREEAENLALFRNLIYSE